MNGIITAEIDVSTRVGRNIVKDLAKRPKVVKLNNPAVAGINNDYDTNRYFGELTDRLNVFYGTDYKLK
jgi:hypothetical protein